MRLGSFMPGTPGPSAWTLLPEVKVRAGVRHLGGQELYQFCYVFQLASNPVVDVLTADRSR